MGGVGGMKKSCGEGAYVAKIEGDFFWQCAGIVSRERRRGSHVGMAAMGDSMRRTATFDTAS
jgi:hypothetical protein